MNTDTIVSRFFKRFGPPKSHYSLLPLIIGEDMQRFGLSFEPQKVLARMIEKHPATYYEITPTQILPVLEYQCKDEGLNVICNWATSRLIAGFSVLDSSPYSRCRVFHTIESMPVLIVREFKEFTAGVFIAPELWTIKDDGSEVPQDINMEVIPQVQAECKWLQQIPNTTWWSVYYTVEYLMRCSNCGTELTMQDFQERSVNHPLCFCCCECDSCFRERQSKDFIEGMRWESRKKWT